METIKQAVRDFIIENFLFGDDNLNDTASLIETGIMDSTGIFELVLFLEDCFALKISDDDIRPENLDSVNNICCFISNRKTRLCAELQA